MEASLMFKIDEKKPREELQLKLSKSSMSLSQSDWKKENMNEICLNIIQWNCTQLWLYVEEKQIIRQISHIQFPCLQLLSLYKNNIESVEGLARVELSNMNSFGIGQNNIHNIREFKKCRWPLLSALYLENNKISQGADLGKALMHYEYEEIFLQDNSTTLLMNDLSFMAKFKQKKINYIGANNASRINQLKLRKSIQFKYKMQ